MKKVCVLGLGYIGLPTASMLATHGFEVVGVDVNPKVVETVNNRKVHIKEPGLLTLVKAATGSGNLRASTSPEAADIFIIAVPTPITEEKKADLLFVQQAVESIVTLLRPENMVILESTSPPGTCRDVLIPILESGGLKVGGNLYLAYCPERVLPGRTVKELIENERVVGGFNIASAEEAAQIYKVFVEGGIHLTDCTTAEMVKLMENTYRDVNIALANELAKISEKLGIDAWEVIRLSNLHPRVNVHLPGPGVGGHCLAVDPWFIVEKFTEEAQVIGLSRQINDNMPYHVVTKIKELLVAIPSPKVAVLGVSYKGNIDDARETPALIVLQGLEKEGIHFSVYDPHVREFKYELSALLETFMGADCILILTDHDEFKFLHPQELAKLMRSHIIFDSKNMINKELWMQYGFDVHCLGKGKK